MNQASGSILTDELNSRSTDQLNGIEDAEINNSIDLKQTSVSQRQ